LTPSESAAPIVSARMMLCAVPDDFDAEGLASTLVDGGLAACVQILPRMTSVYRWKGSVEKATEKLLLIKTIESRVQDVESAIRSRHPYDVPEIIVVEISGGYAPYLAWIAESTTA
jgi:periplasmic divalent cation tolerance protein